MFTLLSKKKCLSCLRYFLFFRLRSSIQGLCSCMLVTVVVHMPRTALEICTLCSFICIISWATCVLTEGINSACSFTAVGVFVLGRLFREAWGSKAAKMQTEFNDFLEVFYTHCSFCQEFHMLTFVLHVPVSGPFSTWYTCKYYYFILWFFFQHSSLIWHLS